MDELIARISQKFDSPLPGWEAHQKMINYKRPKATDIENIDPEARKGGVLALLYPLNKEPHIALMLRNSYQGVHSAQVSFPGGKMEKEDLDLSHTALREAEEELGIIPENVKLLGSLSRVYIPPSRFLVSPFLGVSKQRPEFRLDPTEVAELIEAPLRLFLDSSTIKVKPIYMKVFNGEIEVKYFDIMGHTVWGATAMMVKEIAEIIEN